MSDKTEAFEMGKAAYLRGRPCIPALDAEFMKQLTGSVGTNIELFQAWMKGWIAEIMKEPTT
jgi:hypothetical protein